MPLIHEGIAPAHAKSVVLPYFYNSWCVHTPDQRLNILGDRPQQDGWYSFETRGRNAKLLDPIPTIPNYSILNRLPTSHGFLLGNKVWIQGQRDPAPIRLVPENIEPMAHILVAELNYQSIFKDLAVSDSPWAEVLANAEMGNTSIDHIPDVPAALQNVFQLFCDQKRRVEENRRRIAELARQRREEEERETERLRSEQQLRQMGGTATQRRLLARTNFELAATAALQVGNAQYVSHRQSGNDMIVRFRLNYYLYECVCDQQMRIIDAGICLTDEITGERFDELLTLESLPPVIAEARRNNVLHIYRRVQFQS